MARSLILLCFIVVVRGHTILEEFYCKDSNVEYGKSLRGGNAAGLFDNYGRTKNIQECAMKCCENKKCKVAVMDGRTKICMGVRCFNTSSCETVPAAKGEDDLQIAHISPNTRGNITVDTKTKKLKSHEVEARCPQNEIMYNMKLTGGLQAGKFTDIGRVKSIKTCVRYCCGDAVDCDLAFMLGKRCYLVKCYSEEKCAPLPASDYGFEQKMAFVSPWLFDKRKKIIKVPSGLQPHHMQCTQSKVYTGSKLLGGNDAGRFTHVGKVGKMHICSRQCCEDQNCDLAYMFGKDCFLVKCLDEKNCRVVPDEDLRKSKSTSLTPSFDKQVQYVIKRKYGVKLDEAGNIEEKKDGCHLDGRIRNSTVLERGMLSGRLKTQHGVNKAKHCIERCCGEQKCHVALMLGEICYSMECADAASCKPKPAPDIIKHQNPVVAYVKRGTITMAPSS
ncbi:uncharacterized protein LOC130647712 [Hydractinia symbiolongicarpus]|uniref:uncharacterized protein LOC130647712 n=1 Tax=Hydractinia symbiolongicarpus TaxID=13093 RepID=UPI00254B27DB|nr:uncharacterized protein LOC130647712 [Hydractinia symbiolongicarpus]